MTRSTNPVLVVGATSGIGAAVVRRLLPLGTPIIMASRGRSSATSVDALEPREQILGTEIVDATDEASVEQMAGRIRERYGVLGGIVNCVGSVLLKPAHLTSVAEYDLTFGLNVRSCFLLLRYGVPIMAPGGGSIVFFSTAAAHAGLSNHDVIVAAKSAVEGLTRASAATYAPRRIRVNSIAPGLVRTPLTERIHANSTAAAASTAMHALGRLGEADEIASLVTWLLSDESSWMTGQTLTFDGGLSLRSK